eukprot:12545812-Ditylum_brightwellii.AAC.1
MTNTTTTHADMIQRVAAYDLIEEEEEEEDVVLPLKKKSVKKFKFKETKEKDKKTKGIKQMQHKNKKDIVVEISMRILPMRRMTNMLQQNHTIIQDYGNVKKK